MAWTASVLSYVQAADPGTVGSGNTAKPKNIEYPAGRAVTSLANGTGASQINLGWYSETTYSTGGTTHALNSLTDASTNTGAAVFAAVKYLGVWNADATNTLIVGNGSTPFNPGLSAATTTFTIQPGGHLIFFNPSAAGWTTTSATDLKLVSGASTPTGIVVVLGEA